MSDSRQSTKRAAAVVTITVATGEAETPAPFLVDALRDAVIEPWLRPVVWDIAMDVRTGRRKAWVSPYGPQRRGRR